MSNNITREGSRVYIEDVICKRDTAKAILVSINDEDMWFPVSQLDDETQVSTTGDVGTLVVSAWIAKQQGLIEDD